VLAPRTEGSDVIGKKKNKKKKRKLEAEQVVKAPLVEEAPKLPK